MNRSKPNAVPGNDVAEALIEAFIRDAVSDATDVAVVVQFARDIRPANSYTAEDLMTLGLACRLRRLGKVAESLPEDLPTANDLFHAVFWPIDGLRPLNISALWRTFIQAFYRRCLWSLRGEDAARATLVTSENDDSVIDALSDFLISTLL